MSFKTTNLILSALSKKELDVVSERFERVPLKYGEHLHESGDTIRQLYFPESGIISLLSRADDSSYVEVGVVGKEGMSGFPVALGAKHSASMAIVQGGGAALRISAEDFIKTKNESAALIAAVLGFVNALMTQIASSTACNAYHPSDRRMARWILMTQDRMQSDEFRMTQEFLANMLGVRREAVNKSAGTLRRRGLIEMNRGSLTVRDRSGLEAVACSCYARIVDEYNRSPAV